jgi:hypothetical protein
MDSEMTAISRDRVKQTELVPRLNGPASRGRPLRILFVHSNPVTVSRCVRALPAHQRSGEWFLREVG